MKFTKRLVALMLSLVMVLGAVPTFVTESNAKEATGIYINSIGVANMESANDMYFGGIEVIKEADTFNLRKRDNNALVNTIYYDDSWVSMYENDELKTEDFNFDFSKDYKFVFEVLYSDIKTGDGEFNPVTVIPDDLTVFASGISDWDVDAYYDADGTTLKVTIDLISKTKSNITIKFNPNGGSGDMDDEVITMGDEFELPVCTFTYPERKVFMGWSLSSSGDPIMKDSINDDDYRIYEDGNGFFTLYAIFGEMGILEQPSKENNYTVTTTVSPLDKNINKLTYTWYGPSDFEPVTILFDYEGADPGDNVTDDYYTNESGVYKVYLDQEYFSGIKCSDYLEGLPVRENVGTFSSRIKVQSPVLDWQCRGVLEVDKNYSFNGYSACGTSISRIFNNGTWNDTPEPNISLSLSTTDGTFKVKSLTICGDFALYDNETSASLKSRKAGEYYVEVYGYPAILCSYNSDNFMVDESTPTSSGHTKKYKAKTSTDSGEKVSGSGKKNSTRTITPIEGKKVLNVTVLDKKGNTIEVTPNEDGTFEFIQPASDVTINVEYAKREVALNINSNEVVIDGISSTNDVKPIVKNGTTLLPLRIVAEGLGYQVNWNAFDPNVIELYRSNEETYNLYLNQYFDEYANQMMNYENFLTVENNRTFVEENALGELLGATISTSSENPNQIIVTEE